MKTMASKLSIALALWAHERIAHVTCDIDRGPDEARVGLSLDAR